MCTYATLARGPRSMIQRCQDCRTYVVYFNNLLLHLDTRGLESLKGNLQDCYAHHAPQQLDRDERSITFNTQLEGLHFYFSLDEVAEFLKLIQEAQLAELGIDAENSWS